MKKIIFIATNWGPKHGGINSLNYDICKNLGFSILRKDLLIDCVVSNATNEDILEAKKFNINLISLELDIQFDTSKAIIEKIEKIVTDSNVQFYWVVGHDIFTSTHAKLIKIAIEANTKNRCINVSIHHMDYSAYEGFRKRPNEEITAKIKSQKSILNSADIVIGIGPKLYNSAKNKVRKKEIKIYELLPGMQEIESASIIGSNDLKAITFGRYDRETDIIKQISLVAAGFGEARNLYIDAIGRDATLTIVGITKNNQQAEANELRDILGSYAKRQSAINCFPYTENRQELYGELQGNHVCLMLSVHDGFGLVGLESIAAEVPLILSKNTGLYLLIENCFGKQGLENVIAIDIRGDYTGKLNRSDIKEVAERLKDVANFKDAYKLKAKKLKKLFSRKGYTWESTIKKFLSYLRISDSNKVAGLSSPSFQLNVNLDNLPITDNRIFGRTNVFKKINDLWLSNELNILEIIADGGIGKTALINHWLSNFVLKKYVKLNNIRYIFGWSFYEQGYNDNFVSADLFINSALSFFEKKSVELSSSEKAKRLAKLILKSKSLLILDGLEPLQFPPNDSNYGKLKDESIAILLREISLNRNPHNSLCIITSRIPVYDLKSYENSLIHVELLKELDPLSGVEGFRQLHTNINRSNRKFVASPENLYAFLNKTKALPRINLLVDIYNYVSIKYGLALGAHDLSKIAGNVTLRLTTGNEKFVPLGQIEPKPIPQGDYSYIDDSNEIICHLEVRQVEKTKITLDTTNAFYIVQGNQNTSDEYLNEATMELISLIKHYCGGGELMLTRF